MKNANRTKPKEFINRIGQHDFEIASKQRLAKLEEENLKLEQKQEALEWNSDLMTRLLLDESLKGH